jgi:opacity protein-like surface antigen
MYQSRRVLRPLFSILLTLAPGTALAQSPFEAGEWVVSPAIGFAFDPDADVSPALVGAVGYPVNPSFIIEAELGHLFDLAPGDADVDSSLTTFHAAALYFFDTGYVAAPYVAGGVGIGRFSHDVTNPPASIGTTEVGVNLGGGITYPIRDRVLARGDFRYFGHIDDVPTTWRLIGSVTFALRR